jgi:hypothetical protein
VRCSDAIAAIVERELGRLDPAAAGALEAHLAGCPGCASEAVGERRLAADLAALRGSFPFEIDVASRVMAGLPARLSRPERELTVRQLAWSTAAALVAAVLLIATARGVLPDVETVLRDGIAVWTGLRGVFAQLATVMAGLLSIPFKLLGTAVGFAQSVGRLLEPLQPFGTAVASTAVAGMLGTITWFVGRDLLGRGPAAVARSEHR